MTAPALPGAAPDPARLPPEVESVIKGIDPLKAIADWENADDIAHAVKAYVIAQVRPAIARALGGGGEPVAWGVGSRVVVIGKALNEGHNFVGRTGVVVEPIDHAKARWVRFDGDDNKTSVPMRYLAVATAATGDTTDDACPHHSETGLGGCGRFAWHCDGCGRIRWIYDASKGIGSRADVPRGVVLEGPPTTAVEIARRMLTLGDVALLLERAGSSDDEQGSARRTLLRLEALRNALAAEATRAATGGPDAR